MHFILNRPVLRHSEIHILNVEVLCSIEWQATILCVKASFAIQNALEGMITLFTLVIACQDPGLPLLPSSILVKELNANSDSIPDTTSKGEYLTHCHGCLGSTTSRRPL
jgi:hypothetical protein